MRANGETLLTSGMNLFGSVNGVLHLEHDIVVKLIRQVHCAQRQISKTHNIKNPTFVFNQTLKFVFNVFVE